MAGLKGGRELQMALNQLPAKMEANVVRGGLRVAAKILAGEIKNNCPVRFGELRDSIKVSTGIKNGTVVVKVKMGNKKAWYWHLVEYGTSPHEIKAKDGKSLFIGGLFLTNIEHPGARAHPFVRPAMDSHEQIALQAAMDYMRNRLKTKHGIDTPDSEPDES
jgi:HK97 gp10 family phage protein